MVVVYRGVSLHGGRRLRGGVRSRVAGSGPVVSVDSVDSVESVEGPAGETVGGPFRGGV